MFSIAYHFVGEPNYSVLPFIPQLKMILMYSVNEIETVWEN